MPYVNLLPPDIRARQRDRLIFQGVVGGGAGVLVVLLVLLLVANARIAREEEHLAQEQAQTNELRQRVAELQRFEDLQQQVEARRGTLAQALVADVAWSRLLNDLSLVMPDNSWLTNLTISATRGSTPDAQQEAFGTVAFQGFVFDFPGLAGWLTRTDIVDGLYFLYLSSGTRQELFEREVVSFSANASITEELLSRRCAEGRPCP